VTQPQGSSGRPARPLSVLAVALAALALGGGHAFAEEAGHGGSPKAEVVKQGPLDLVRSSVLLVFAIIRSQPDSAQRRIEIRQVGETLFDFNEMARRALARHWSARSSEERGTFVRLFTDLLERSYVTAIGNNALASVTFQDEAIEGSAARMRSRLVTDRGAEFPMEYRLLDNAGRWAVYDVVVDGASVVASYRSQFNSILRTSSFDLLLDKLQNRNAHGAEAP
jgi:phospholipid transport system substrate-binding protein